MKKHRKLLYAILAIAVFYSVHGFAQAILKNGGTSQIRIMSGSYIVIHGNMVDKTGGTTDIDNYGIIKINGHIIDSTNSGGTMFSTTHGKIILAGSAVQSIDGTRKVHFYDLEINNPGGLILDTAIYIHHSLTLSNGKIFTGDGKELNMLAGTSYTGGSDQSFVDGPMKKSGGDDFIFPVGDKGHIQQIAILDLNSTETFTAEYVRGTPPQNTNLGGNLSRVSSVEYWHLTPESGNPQINMALYWNNGDTSGITNPQTLLIAHQKSNGQWEDIPYISGTGSASAGSIKGGPVSTYSLYSFGTNNTNDNPLPIELLSFQAKANEDFTVDLSWITASEQNNDYFSVERSQNGIDWEEVGRVKGAGNSNQILRYFLVDYKPFKGTSYYRLKQTDFDGTFTYSDMVSVSFDPEHMPILVYPNPVHSILYVRNIPEASQFRVLNIVGDIVMQGSITQDFTLDFSTLPNGIYQLHIYSDKYSNDNQVFKIIRN